MFTLEAPGGNLAHAQDGSLAAAVSCSRPFDPRRNDASHSETSGLRWKHERFRSASCPSTRRCFVCSRCHMSAHVAPRKAKGGNVIVCIWTPMHFCSSCPILSQSFASHKNSLAHCIICQLDAFSNMRLAKGYEDRKV